MSDHKRVKDEEQPEETGTSPLPSNDPASTDIQCLMPALTNVLTSDSFLHNLVVVCMDKTQKEQVPMGSGLQPKQPPASCQAASGHSRQHTPSTSSHQSNRADFTNASPDDAQSQRKELAAKSPTFKAAEVKVLLKAFKCPLPTNQCGAEVDDSDSGSLQPERKKHAAKKPKKTWVMPSFKDPSQCSWRNPDLVIRHRYRVLADIATKLHMFHAMHISIDDDL